ncbi:hypothetical protein [Candidatus Hodgkinia cicadicola]|uniref:hypothetical protein n=1 Tax=Candidatus Hodgkinia cicadicola TaxID=573658 RepID=UPI0011BA5ED6
MRWNHVLGLGDLRLLGHEMGLVSSCVHLVGSDDGIRCWFDYSDGIWWYWVLLSGDRRLDNCKVYTYTLLDGGCLQFRLTFC